MSQSFGARLRAQREERQVSLATISAKLKLRVSLLEQLESDRVAYWPRGIFGRAYLRDYAREIGMEPESVVREFVMRYPETGDDPSWPPQPVTAQAPHFAAPPRPAPAPEPEFDPEPEPEPEFVAEPQPATAALQEIESQPQPLVMTPPAPVIERRRGGDRREVSLAAAADVCSRLARALDARDITTLLADAGRLLDAVGIVVWLWDPAIRALKASVAHGYSSTALARLPTVRADETNAIAAAYRSGEPCIVDSQDGSTGAVVVPSLGPTGCVGVLALEVRSGGERNDSLRAFATILAAQLGILLPGAEQASVSPA